MHAHAPTSRQNLYQTHAWQYSCWWWYLMTMIPMTLMIYTEMPPALIYINATLDDSSPGNSFSSLYFCYGNQNRCKIIVQKAYSLRWESFFMLYTVLFGPLRITQYLSISVKHITRHSMHYLFRSVFHDFFCGE